MNMSNHKTIKAILGNRRTTAAAICGAIAVIAGQLQALLDGDPATVCDWNTIIMGGVIVLIGLFAKDGDKSTEELGI